MKANQESQNLTGGRNEKVRPASKQTETLDGGVNNVDFISLPKILIEVGSLGAEGLGDRILGVEELGT